jgi:hypothetical protein
MTDGQPPIVIDLGKHGRKKLKQLKAGGGPLLEEVLESLHQVRASLGPGDSRALLPVVVLFERKPRKPRKAGRNTLRLLPFKM